MSETTAAMRRRSVLCASPSGLHRMAYTEWGDPANPKVLFCVHGLTRNGRDFDYLASRLAPHYRIVCPDVVGRGESDRLTDPAGYVLPQYVADMLVLLARLDVEEIHWVGTSMGGLIGMILASLDRTPIRRLVLNDVGPAIATEALARIGEYLGKAPRFPSFADADRFVRFVSAPFGALSDSAWKHLTETSVRQAADGWWEMRYDPGIAEPFRQAAGGAPVDLWPIYDAIRCPTLLTRGEQSDLLTRETATEMAARGPRARVVEIPGVGHAPMFLDAGQADIVAGFLLEG